MNVEINGQTYIQAGDKIGLEIGATPANTDKKLDDTLSGNYIVTHLRHTFTVSQETKHKIIMRVAKDSKKGNFYSSDGIQQTSPVGILINQLQKKLNWITNILHCRKGGL